jgi:hypothetical protein
MTALDRFVPRPRMVEVDHVDLAIPPERAWTLVRHADLVQGTLVRALFAIRTLPDRLKGDTRPLSARIDELRSAPDRPGFQILADEPREVVVGAIGKVWKLEIPFVHVTPEAYSAFDEPDYVKVAWAIGAEPLGEGDSRVTFELRVDATDDRAWRKFRRYFRVIGPGSHLIRRSLLSALAREHGTPASKADERPLAGDDLLGDANSQATHAIDIDARPEAVWPWLVQMGRRRAGWYSWDLLDNGGHRSARELHPELQRVEVGQVLPATPDGKDGFEVLRVEPNRALVLGGLWDVAGKRQLPFAAPRPASYWQVTWAFDLQPRGEGTRLRVRARVAFSPDEVSHAWRVKPIHGFMERRQLHELKTRAEGHLPADDWRDVLRGAGGAAVMLASLVTPFLRRTRNHWGLSEGDAAREYPGDDVVAKPDWMWTHAIEIDAPIDRAWPWVAQVGADRAGFYSYQWLENLIGCDLRNAESIHPEWAHRSGDTLVVHPKAPPLDVRAEPGRWLYAYASAEEADKAAGRPWASVSWLFYLEPLGPERTRFISRYRVASSHDLASRLRLGPALMEPVGFAMDRRMLASVKERAERKATIAAAVA